MKETLLVFVPIFVAVDAVGIIPIFLSLTEGMSQTDKRKLIRHSIFTALFVAVLFLWMGQKVLSLLGVTMSDFLVAGGAILFILSIRDLLSFGKGPKLPVETLGAVPLAVPLIVGPAVLTTSLILSNQFGFFPTAVSIVANIILCGIILFFSEGLSKILGKSGSHTLSKIFNLVLGAIGIMLMRKGLGEIFSVWFSK